MLSDADGYHRTRDQRQQSRRGGAARYAQAQLLGGQELLHPIRAVLPNAA
jgi:hypothetical protein